MGAKSLLTWLDKLELRSPEAKIDLGLDRVRRVHRALGLGTNPVTVTVAGTNGKGSTVAYLESIFRSAGYRVLAYTSPHLIQFSERIRICGEPASDAALAAAIEAVEAARGDEPLTYFEHITLAALLLGETERVDIRLLEVGLGGRLDAVNVVDSDVAILTSIGLDHMDWLGPTRRLIGREKAGIARPCRPLIVGERRLPRGSMDDLQATGADVQIVGRDFQTRRQRGQFQLLTGQKVLTLPMPALRGVHQLGNAACAVMAAMSLADRCPVGPEDLATGLRQAKLFGRQQLIQLDPVVIVDVAHNAAAARELAASLGSSTGRSYAVFAALADKDAAAMARVMDTCIDHWLVTGLDSPRAVPASELVEQLASVPVTGSVEAVESPAVAIRSALRRCGRNGRVVVFGSFRTVAEAWPELEKLG